MLRTISYLEGLTVDIKRTLAGASIIGMVGLPAWLLGAGVAAAEPAPGPQQCADPANCQQAPAEQKNEEKKNNASNHPGIKIPESWSREVAKNVANLPSPVEANGSVPISIGLPDVVPDISVPFIVNPPALNIPGPSLPPPPAIGMPKPPDLTGPFAMLTPW
jgi:hypothetical protein